MARAKRTRLQNTLKLSLRTRRYLKGDAVEVWQTDEGLRGAWYTALVVEEKHGQRVVEYDELLADEGSSTRLRETLAISATDDGRSFVRPRVAARSTKCCLRPHPPSLLAAPPSSWKRGTWVDCWYHDGWWEGTLNEDVSYVKEPNAFESDVTVIVKSTVEVLFSSEGLEVLSIPVRCIRLTQDFLEDGTWRLRGKVDLL